MSDLRPTHWTEIRDTLNGKREKIHTALGVYGPCTAKELAEAVGWDKCSIRPRLTELHQAGLATTDGRRNGEHIFKFISLKAAEQAHPSNSPTIQENLSL